MEDERNNVAARARGAPAQRADPRPAATGAPPTNRAPDNCIDTGYRLLRHGIDSLYLSYAGKLAADWAERLRDLKTNAQSDEEGERALAQVKIGPHLLEVADKAKRPFAFTLIDNCFHIQISGGKTASVPLAYVQVSSEYLAAVGLEAAETDLRFIVSTLGLVEGQALVSRADPFVDFVCLVDLNQFSEADWIVRAHVLSKFWHRGRFSGFSIGRGGDLSSRLYDKTLEIEVKSHKFYIHDLWKEAGWDGTQAVYRQEFQARRGLLKAVGIHTVPDLLETLPLLWQYTTQDWLRLTIPSATDSTQTRWPNHALWDGISASFLVSSDQPRLKRFSPARLPRDERLYEQGLGYVSSFMASRGIGDWGEGLGEYLHGMKHHFDGKERKSKKGFYGHLDEKVRGKGRRYNTIRNRPKDGSDEAEIAKRAKAYRRAKDGDDEDA